MSQQLIDRSPDLKRLVDEGYEVEIESGHLLLRHVPYVTKGKGIKYGTLVSRLTLAGDVTTKPEDHVVMFAGDLPCDSDGKPLIQIQASDRRQRLGGGLLVDRMFSRKPMGGYSDFYHKMTVYEGMISGYVRPIDPTATARTFATTESHDSESVFAYEDTATSRIGIGAISDKLKVGPVAIVGVGGTGSYILDLVAKTPVPGIHLFDGDRFEQHNAFRSPGAPSLGVLKSAPTKASYCKTLYGHMHLNIFDHGHIDTATITWLRSMHFVFVAVDNGPSRKMVIGKLIEWGIPFIDVGMGVNESSASLFGQIRSTLYTGKPQDVSIIASLPLSDIDVDNEYSRNIQIAELNALNAALAVIKWKKFLGFYVDIEQEQSCYYQIDGNYIVNESKI